MLRMDEVEGSLDTLAILRSSYRDGNGLCCIGISPLGRCTYHELSEKAGYLHAGFKLQSHILHVIGI